MTTQDFNAFELLFYRDLEKWFSADIACCDNCHSDFLETWPYADQANDYHFQRNFISLDCFYSGGYLQDHYSKSDFDRLVTRLYCPRCGEQLSGNIWAFNLPFNVPRDIEQTIREVATTAQATPFLLLENEFCKNVLNSIRSLSKEIVPKRFDQTLFRGRTESSEPIFEHISSFDFPPANVVKEGRYNHAGNPVLYLASDIETCHAELRHAPSLIAEINLATEIKMLDLLNPYTEDRKSSENADLLNCLVYSALLSTPQDSDGWHRPHYVVSRFVADCAKISGLDAIRYPSTRRTDKSFNLVIVNPALSLAHVGSIIKYHKR